MILLEHLLQDSWRHTPNKTMGRNDARRVAKGRPQWYLLRPDPSCNGEANSLDLPTFPAKSVWLPVPLFTGHSRPSTV